MSVGVVLLNFGEPEQPEEGAVLAFLQRIFLSNARLEDATGEAARARAQELAARRAPGLLEDYRAMGGSPLNAQTERQAAAVRAELVGRGRSDPVFVGMQFTEPGIGTAVASARAWGVDRLVGLPLYPLCGPSTTVAALSELQAAVADQGWNVPVTGISGWHTRMGYTALRADGVSEYCAAVGLELGDPGTRLVFSAHGTPIRYLQEGSRYDAYVEDHARRLSEALGVDHVLGYQNHSNRGVEWTEPAIEDVIADIDADRVVVVPVSFMQEQSETLHELDRELRSVAEDRGLRFHRVPIPYDDPRFARVLADLLEPVLNDDAVAFGYRPCRCAGDGVLCLNRDLGRDPRP